MALLSPNTPQKLVPVVVLLSAHFFVFYFGIIADITPPVALARLRHQVFLVVTLSKQV